MKFPITKRGLILLHQKIESQRDRVKATGAEVGAEAGLNCDWHDNFGYEDAKRRLEIESTRLREMQRQVESSQLTQVREQNEVVALGTTVRLILENRELEYTIAGIGEGDPALGIISIDAPLAQAVMGLGEGEEISIGGDVSSGHAEIIEILPPSYRYSQLLD